MFISVIVPTRNRALYLRDMLHSIARQSLANDAFEVIVIDNGSTDETNSVLHKFCAGALNFRGVFVLEPGLHVGRHVGMLSACGDILVFADDDIEALPTWLSSIREAFLEPSVAMAGGNNLPKFLESPPLWVLKLWNRCNRYGYKSIPELSVLEVGRIKQYISPYWIWGCNFAIRKDVLLAAGGFHPDGMPTDLIRFRGDGESHVSRFVAESNMRCVFHPGASVYHKVPSSRMTYQYFYQRGFNQGVSDSYTDLREGKSKDNNRSSVVGFAYDKFRQAVRYGMNRFFLCQDSLYALNMFNIGHKKGYIYHQELYKLDVEVRDWVHRENYY